MPISEEEARALAALDLPAMLAFLDELVAVPSLGGAETPAQKLVAAQMAACGLEVDVWELDFAALSRHPAYGAEVARAEGLGVVGTLGRGEGPALILNGHVDVVPAGELANWHYPPWRATLAGDRVYGRGTVDMKGGLCCALFAARAIVDAGIPLAGRLIIQSVIGEEDGGAGTLAALLRGYRADAALIMEPTGLAIAPAQAGALNFRLTVPGQAAHGCMRQEGVSAIDKFLPLYRALLALEQRVNARPRDPLFAAYALPYPLSVGTLQAGDWPSTVPERATCEGRLGVPLGQELAQARRELEEAVAGAAQADPWLRQHPPQVEWWGGQFAPARTDPGHPIVATVAQACRQASGQAAPLRGMTYGADMRLLVNQGGIPTVMFGPGDVRQAHRPDEFVPLAGLETVARTLVLAILRFCGVRAA